MRTQIQFLTEENVYVPGEGATKDLVPIKSGEQEYFYCDWQGTYGAYREMAMADGVIESYSVKMPYVPIIFDALAEKDVIITKDKKEYQLYSSVEDIDEKRKKMKFLVRRFERK